MRIIRTLVLGLLVLFAVANIVDVAVAGRPLLHQLRLFNLLTAPLNAAVHVGTPPWLRGKLAISPILKPTPKLFPSVQRLRDALPMIQEEAQAAMAASKPIKNDLFFEGIADDGWKRFYIKWYGPVDPQARRICPRTAELLESMPEVHLGMFSILMPGSVIPPHCGPTRMCLRYHLGLFTPNDDACRIRVGGHSYSWRDGEDVVFDDTVMHDVANNTNEPRIILFLDIERPQEGVLKGLTKAMIKYGGPATTRANDTLEKVVRAVPASS
jgi:beta-hydroxylase